MPPSDARLLSEPKTTGSCSRRSARSIPPRARPTGAPRVHAMLARRGVRVGRKRVARLMRRDGLTGLIRRKRGKTTIRVPGVACAPDLVRRAWNPPEPNRLWVADITYVRTWEGWLYLAAVLDCHSRRCVGWSIADHLRAELVVDAVEMAISRRRPGRGLVHHSDHGSQGGLNRPSQQCVRQMNLGTAADGALEFAAGTRLAWRGRRRGGSPGGRAEAAIAACAPSARRGRSRPQCSALVTQTLSVRAGSSVAVAQAAASRCSLSTSAGVLQPRVFLGRVFRAVATAARSSGLCRARSVPFEVLAQQPVGVLVGGALPRALRVAEVDLKAGVDPQLRVLGHLGALVPGQ